MTALQFARVLVDSPLPPLDYKVPEDMALAAGDRVVVPLQSRKVVGVVAQLLPATTVEAKKIRSVIKLLGDTRPLSEEWLEFTKFASDYYLAFWGEAALAALPPFWRRVPKARHEATVAGMRVLKIKSVTPSVPPVLNAEQTQAVAAITSAQGFAPFLLFGVTGSGKTEVYLTAMQAALKRDPEAQVLLLVPEINLTPQLEKRVRSRFAEETVVTLHSKLTLKERAANWLAVHEGRARVLVGTRLSIFASFMKLALILVDEEHDASYKAGDGIYYSARDLAVKRAHSLGITCVLGSATPSLETWAKAREGRYRLLKMTTRAAAHAKLPELKLIDTREEKGGTVITGRLKAEVDAALERKEQALLFVNRRGYAPTLTCTACGWVSRCEHCSSFTVYHKAEKKLVCHHCGTRYPIPLHCPSCGNADLLALGSGTQKIEEVVQATWPDKAILRIDSDSTTRKGAAEEAFEKVHAGKADIVVGTQMIAKGHDFQRVSVVGVLNADAQLVSPDLRAEERLFATLMQVAGRAGRGETTGEVAVQTRFPDHPIYDALKHQDYEVFAERLLSDRRDLNAPPFVFQALLKAQANTLERALGFLTRAAAAAPAVNEDGAVFVYDPVPMSLFRLMDVERGQLLVESASRSALHRFLKRWTGQMASETGVSWRIEVDPQEV